MFKRVLTRRDGAEDGVKASIMTADVQSWNSSHSFHSFSISRDCFIIDRRRTMLILKLAGIIEKIEFAYVWNHEGLELFQAFDDIEIWHRSLIVETQNGIQKSLCFIHFQNSELLFWITVNLTEDQ